MHISRLLVQAKVFSELRMDVKLKEHTLVFKKTYFVKERMLF